jgi:hypothetical protein
MGALSLLLEGEELLIEGLIFVLLTMNRRLQSVVILNEGGLDLLQNVLILVNQVVKEGVNVATEPRRFVLVVTH